LFIVSRFGFQNLANKITQHARLHSAIKPQYPCVPLNFG